MGARPVDVELFFVRSMKLILAGLTINLVGAYALAADLPPAPVLDEAEDEIGSGWYLRGDIGALAQSIPHKQRTYGFGGVPSVSHARFDRNISAGLGVGYQFSPWFRAEVAVDQRFEASYKGTRFGAGSTAVDRADFYATTVMANAYVDLPVAAGITPYIGAGIGFSRNRIEASERALYGADGAFTGISLLNARTDTSFIWALMAGVAFDITHSIKIDLGYRYTRLGDARSRYGDNAPAIRASDIDGHELRIGARYVFN
ncbi:outer membrane protein [Microvirga flavescens]|uniref:outer membrane protein n=1 Tax=Microvirga flavescens TaxID=2249811 RepID=UPI000DD79A73|nr:outer membrane protein [Microvirga flavescens]